MKSIETFMKCQMYLSLFIMVHRCGNTSYFSTNFSILIVNCKNWGLQQNIWTSEHGAKMKSQTVLNNCWMACTVGMVKGIHADLYCNWHGVSHVRYLAPISFKWYHRLIWTPLYQYIYIYIIFIGLSTNTHQFVHKYIHKFISVNFVFEKESQNLYHFVFR